MAVLAEEEETCVFSAAANASSALAVFIGSWMRVRSGRASEREATDRREATGLSDTCPRGVGK